MASRIVVGEGTERYLARMVANAERAEQVLRFLAPAVRRLHGWEREMVERVIGEVRAWRAGGAVPGIGDETLVRLARIAERMDGV